MFLPAANDVCISVLHTANPIVWVFLSVQIYPNLTVVDQLLCVFANFENLIL